MPTTVSELIHSSMRLIGAIAAAETLETNELNDAFDSLNQMIASWNTEGLSIAGRQTVFLNVGPATNSYPVPPPRPVHIEAAEVAIAGINCGLEIVDSAGWAAIPEKEQIAIITRKLYCDYAYPTPNVSIWPVAKQAGILSLVVYQPITVFAALADVINLPPGYEAALRYNFAVNLAPEYGRPIDQVVPAQAQNFKASLVQLNASNHARSAQPVLPVGNAA